MKKEKCSICEEPITEEDEKHYTIEGKSACEGCWENEMQYPSTLIKFSPDKKIVISHFTKNFGDENGELPIPIKKQKWVSTDAWRGYTDWELIEGYENIADGWITSMPDRNTKRKLELADMFEDLKTGKVSPPCDIYWIFGITSNVFSTASEIVAEKGNRDLIEKWLNKINGGIEELQEKFS